jgi:hypothetical protein
LRAPREESHSSLRKSTKYLAKTPRIKDDEVVSNVFEGDDISTRKDSVRISNMFNLEDYSVRHSVYMQI